MKLISKVKIEGFRSIRKATIEGLEDFTVFAGLNNSGKSNVLRALNAFFNSETDPEQFVDVDEDFYRPDLRKKRKKRITISVCFDLPPIFTFRKGLEPIEEFFNGRSFEIKKEWTRDQFLPVYYLEGRKLDSDEQQKIEQFLQLIKFRYIPNRIMPTEVIRGEHEALRDVLIRRLARRAKRDRIAFDAIQRVSKSLIQSLAQRFSQACPNDGTVELGTPTSWRDMVFAFGYRLLKGGIEIEDFLQGSGVQSLLMLETLYLIDRDYFQQFGWRQAAIWGIEEPESSLHLSLEARVAAYLSQISNEASSRLQIFCTSHSDLMVQYAGKIIVSSQQKGESIFDGHTDPRKALNRLSRSGVSRWVHPLLFYPLDPIILVEGKHDRTYFKEALRFIKPSRRVRVSFLELLSNTGATGGVENLSRYIKENADAIRGRPIDAPVVVVLDWDARKKVDSLKKLIKDKARYKVLAWTDDSLNPNLGKSFKGIERAYSDRIIKAGIAAGIPIGQKTSGEYIVESEDYGQVKAELYKIVSRGLESRDFKLSQTFIKRVLEKVKTEF